MQAEIQSLLHQAKITDRLTHISSPLLGGANNRVYRVDFDRREPLICKHYFKDREDQRQRLATEFSFLTFAWKIRLRCIPQPIYADEKHNLALYSCIPGHSITPEKISPQIIQAAQDFFLKLNHHKNDGSQLPNASESCFCVHDYFETVENKLAKCLKISEENALYRRVKTFVKSSLIPTWQQVKGEVEKRFILDLFEPLPRQDLCITPSDFSPHNMLIDSSERVYFLDFEYAGWDDPAKTACDFFCQPKIPVPFTYFDRFTEAIAATTTDPQKTQLRIQAMLPICQIKWCCIMLNGFQSTGRKRRDFSNPEHLNRLEKQFLLAQNYLQNIKLQAFV